MGHCGPENDMSSELWICSVDLLKIFCNERGQKVHQNNINGFLKKFGHFGRKSRKERGQDIHKNYFNGIFRKVIWGKLAILGPKIMHGHNSGSTLRVVYKFCTIKKVNW